MPGVAHAGSGQQHVAEDVDAPRNAAGVVQYPGQQFVLEVHALSAARGEQAKLDVAAHFLLVERRDVGMQADALRQGGVFRPGKPFDQLRLAAEHDLQDLAAMAFEAGELADLLEHFGTQLLGLVHRQHHPLAGIVGFLGEASQGRLQQGLVVGRRFDAELQAGGDQKLPIVELGLLQARHQHLLRRLAQHVLEHHGLAHAGLAGEHADAVGRLQQIVEIGRGLGVSVAHEEISRVGGQPERMIIELEEFAVHAPISAGVATCPAPRCSGLFSCFDPKYSACRRGP